MDDFAAKVVKALIQNHGSPAANISLVIGSVRPDTSKGPLNTTTRIGEFQVNYPGHNLGTTPDIRIQFYEHFAGN
eukprot:607918-Prymnesium_polylepis.1